MQHASQTINKYKIMAFTQSLDKILNIKVDRAAYQTTIDFVSDNFRQYLIATVFLYGC